MCYTFDAGPNACLFLLSEHVPLVHAILKRAFFQDNADDGQEVTRGAAVEGKVDDVQLEVKVFLFALYRTYGA